MRLINADCIAAMKEMPDNSVDSIVTDPPYELGFMGKSWDASGIAFNVEVWREALRVIKPGGHLIAFSGSRTYHRMAVAIEDAGFQIRDQIMWVYGSGFPKSHNISKALDKAAGAEREVVGQKITGNARTDEGWAGGQIIIDETAPATAAAKQWQGWGTALKPAHERMVLARKPLEGTVADNVLTYGAGGMNIEATRVPSDNGFEKAWDKPVSTNISAEGGKYISEGAKHTVDLTDYRPSGRFPANFIHDGSDEVVALFPTTSPSPKGFITQGGKASGGFDVGSSDGTRNTKFQGHGDSGSAARFFYCAKASKKDRNEGLDGFEGKEIGAKGNGLARICATCGASVIDGCNCPDRTFVNPTRANHHPTVKPTTLMQYLVRLVTPPNGTVLDPFMGSGSTGKACAYEGFDFIGIDQSAEYVAIAKARIDYVHAHLEEVIFPKGYGRATDVE
jgi:site-specific DNA-methyltransferase (adenine-specific)